MLPGRPTGRIYDSSDGVGNPAAAGLPLWPHMVNVHDAYNEVIVAAAAGRDNVHIVDMHREFLGHGVLCIQWWREHHRREDPRYWYFASLENPNDRGYDAIRRSFLIKMAKTLPQKLSTKD